MDSKLNYRLVASVAQDGVPAFELFDADGTARARTARDADGNPSIGLLDADGGVLWSAPRCR